MYKLLVVDDEPRQVRSLANIISQLRPDYEVYTASGGNQALEILMKNPFDIVFTDIRMPEMDGLQLIECLNQNGITLKTVILSGYGEFEYAQKAIRYGVKEYLVKPIGKADIEQILSKIEESLQYEQQAKAREEEMEQKLSCSLPVYLEHQLNKWVAGGLSEAERKEIESIFPYRGQGAVLTTVFTRKGDYQNELNAEFRQHAKFYIKEALKIAGHSISFFNESDKRQMITVVAMEPPAVIPLTGILKKLLKFIEHIEDEFGYTTIIGVSTQADNLMDNIVQVYLESQEASEQRFFSGNEKVIFRTAAIDQAIFPPFRTDELESSLAEALRTGSRENVTRITSELFSALKPGCGIKPVKVKENIIHLLLHQSKILINLISHEEYTTLTETTKIKSLQCETVSELWHFANETLYGIIEKLHHQINDKNGILINACKKYLDENYMEDISLEAAAQRYFFNPSYFSNLFKGHVGIGFSEYLLQVRLQNAQKMLKNTDDSIAEIARKVGFKDPSYFNRVFKRETGVSPLRYRQLSGSR